MSQQLLIIYSNSDRAAIASVVRALRTDGYTLLSNVYAARDKPIAACIWFTSQEGLKDKTVVKRIRQANRIGIPVIPIIVGNIDIKAGSFPIKVPQSPIKITNLKQTETAIDELKRRLRSTVFIPPNPNTQSRNGCVGSSLLVIIVTIIAVCVVALLLLPRSIPLPNGLVESPTATETLTRPPNTRVAQNVTRTVTPTQTATATVTLTPTASQMASESPSPEPSQTAMPSATITETQVSSITPTALPLSPEVSSQAGTPGIEVDGIAAYFFRGCDRQVVQSLSNQAIIPIGRSSSGQLVQINSGTCIGCWVPTSSLPTVDLSELPIIELPECPVPTEAPTAVIISIVQVPLPPPNDNPVPPPVNAPPNMVLVTAGTSTIGSNQGYYGDGIHMDESPPHPQTINRFWIDRTEVTAQQYVTFLNQLGPGSHANGCYGFRCAYKANEGGVIEPTDTGYEVAEFSAQRAMYSVTWFGAKAYCENRGKRLPTEVEWEYAARGPENRIYPWGNTFDPNRVFYGGNSTGSGPTFVDSLANGASWIGALNMSGNVAEWTSTALGIRTRYDIPYGIDQFTILWNYPWLNDEREQRNGDTVYARIIRGGSWLEEAEYLKGSTRRWSVEGLGSSDIGFRCVQNY